MGDEKKKLRERSAGGGEPFEGRPSVGADELLRRLQEEQLKHKIKDHLDGAKP